MLAAKENEEEEAAAGNEISDKPVEKFSKTEVNGKFKIMRQWDERLNDPESEEFKSYSETITRGIEDMLAQDETFTEQADFNVTIVGFRFARKRITVLEVNNNVTPPSTHLSQARECRVQFQSELHPERRLRCRPIHHHPVQRDNVAGEGVQLSTGRTLPTLCYSSRVLQSSKLVLLMFCICDLYMLNC